jgi:hypothetical protein
MIAGWLVGTLLKYIEEAGCYDSGHSRNSTDEKASHHEV